MTIGKSDGDIAQRDIMGDKKDIDNEDDAKKLGSPGNEDGENLMANDN